MSEEKKPFTVTDRRHFTTEGEAREGAHAVADHPAGEPPPRAHGPELELEADFAGFLIGLGAQASLLLGGESIEKPPSAEDLRGVRHVISILEMLRDRTEGHRTREEDQVLDGILYELRMGYVSRTRAGGV